MLRKAVLSSVAALALVALLGVAGCGEDDDPDGGAAIATDGAFLTEMADHHDAAIEMAALATERAEHAEVRDLADRIVAAQSEEIEAMEAMHERMFGEPMGAMNHGTLGMDMEMMGMDQDMMSLEQATPFDRAFIDAMIAHHQGAIRMARVQLERGEDGELKDLAEAVIEAQSREIEQMNEWHARWYGSRSPAGGIPDEDEVMPGHEAMGH